MIELAIAPTDGWLLLATTAVILGLAAAVVVELLARGPRR